MLPFHGSTILEFQLERLRRCQFVDQIVIATTDGPGDDVIAQFCEKHDVACFRGSEEDVLGRYKGAADAYAGSVIVRVTSDCPLIDPEVVDDVIATYLYIEPPYDFVSNTIKRTYPRGMDVEVFSYESLKIADQKAKLPAEREHVTPYIIQHPKQFKIYQVSREKDDSKHRWTLDTEEDFQLIDKLAGAFYPAKPQFTLDDLLRISEQHPEWSDINAHIVQKSI
jgi:spore coat polysaccharide biosynthesis protein SpsF